MIFFTFADKNTAGNDDSSEKYKKFQRLYDDYKKYVYRIVMNTTGQTNDLDDIVQKVFIKVWRNIDKLGDSEVVKPWIGTIARNCSIDYLRIKGRKDKYLVDADDDVLFATTPERNMLPEDILTGEAGVNYIHDTIQHMDKKYAEVLMLYIVCEQPVEKIAELLNRNEKTVYTQINRGRKALRELLLQGEKEGNVG